jgi:hypothetical protein
MRADDVAVGMGWEERVGERRWMFKFGGGGLEA